MPQTYKVSNLTYDQNGNLLTLTRGTSGGINQLSYSYGDGNKLLSVTDASRNTLDFSDGNTIGNDYEYWPDGSLKKDLNRGISQIDYNLLKLPKQISFSNGKVVSYTYTATGQKLRMSTSTGQIRDYLTEYENLNGQFDFLHTPEGRASSVGYEYYHKDHLGNIRAVYWDSLGVLKVNQWRDYDPWGLELSGLSSGNSSNRLKFNGKESLAELGSGVLDYGARLYDASIGRWGVVDPLAEVSRRFSPFVYGNNNPVRMIDPDGRETQEFQRSNRDDFGNVTFNGFAGVSEGGYVSGSTAGDGPGKGKNTQISPDATTAIDRENDANFKEQTKGLGSDLAQNLVAIGKFLFGVVDQDPNGPTKAMMPIPFFMGGGSSAAKISTLVEANAARQLASMEAATSGAHFFSRHGAGTTLAQQEIRALTGLTPDGIQQKTVQDASRFLSHQLQLQSIQRAQTIFNQTGKNVVKFNMGQVVGEGYLRGGSPIIQSSDVRAIFRGGNLITIFPLVR